MHIVKWVVSNVQNLLCRNPCPVNGHGEKSAVWFLIALFVRTQHELKILVEVVDAEKTMETEVPIADDSARDSQLLQACEARPSIGEQAKIFAVGPIKIMVCSGNKAIRHFLAPTLAPGELVSDLAPPALG